MKETPVLIAGGGPVGMTLALELAHQGIRVTLAERNPGTTRHPKMDLTNGRSMEIFRRLGLVNKLREVGVPEANPFVISWITSLSGHELCRFTYPSSAEGREIRRQRNDGSLTLEPPMRVSQVVIEPALKAAVESNDFIDSFFGWNVESLAQDDGGVTTRVTNGERGQSQEIRSQYVVGCDGGTSTVRRQLGIALQGQSNEAQAYMIHFRSTDLDLLQRFGIAWHYQTGAGTMIAQNDADTWTLQYFVPPGVDAASLDPDQVLQGWMGKKFDYEIILANPWWAHFLVADRYRSGRVLIAGDACHQWMPTGGYGMNSGVVDATNLGWKLAAKLDGWGGDALLDSYEAERRPVALMSRDTSHRHLGVRIQIAHLYMEAGDMGGDSADAERRREEVGASILALGNAENEAWGTEHGYRYESAAVVPEAGTPPAFDPLCYVPSTWPGSRLPHLFLADGTAVYDRLGLWYTLIAFGDTPTNTLMDAAKAAGVPVKLLMLDDAHARDVYGANLLVVRPDQHIAWRGEAVPTDTAAIVAALKG
jgi:2-polyprenyl-6-methoxyphenol hydroxylase-like FAD-dependent oxidoreductase